MNRAVIAVADQVIVQELRSRLDQSEVAVEVAFVAESTQEMTAAVLSHRPALLFVHDQLGPGPVMQLVRDLTLRNPALAVAIVSTRSETDAYADALEAGARGVLVQPFGLEDLDRLLATMTQWNATVREVLSRKSDDGEQQQRGGRVVAIAGAKGGVGTTVMASHLAWDAATSDRRMRVCLVDLDVENGDVPSYIDVSHRVSIADLAKISEDITSRAVNDTVVVHSSGLHLLLAPNEIRDTEFVTPQAVRRIVAELRNLYHLVVLDVGSAVTTTQAAAVESADVTLQVVTADVPALRSARRQVLAWESLGVAGAESVHAVVNRFQRRSEIQQDTIDALLLAQRSQVLVPDLERGLERAGNSRTPSEVRNQTWWKSLRAIGQELEVGRRFAEELRSAQNAEAADAVSPRGDAAGAGRRGRRSARVREAGQATIETVAMLPFALLVLLLCGQLLLLGISTAVAGAAAQEAARAVSLGQDPAAAARSVIPDGMQRSTTITSTATSVRVVVRTPLQIAPGVERELPVGVDHTVVKEPR
ncbi:cellulose synthase operon protein YhjQ/BcsQ [Microlunatus flavus]|uniref:Pilus assembly protein CpaE n=1 Tax=Microlunatus flavus TaxID=1036181 RepID=A0A1H9A188_9ACTN|nr:cellulose synthase operon protein YhjQ/BcsQ [Microlunatus flavus]SEP70429.1 pilus assembly protein CpaE [Microlunatus flavus]